MTQLSNILERIMLNIVRLDGPRRNTMLPAEIMM